MKIVLPNRKIRLKFDDHEEGIYFFRNSKMSLIDLKTISTESPIGKAILGKREGEKISIKVGSIDSWCEIVKVYHERN